MSQLTAYVSKAKELIRRWLAERGCSVETSSEHDELSMTFVEGDNTVIVRVAYLDVPSISDLSREVTLLASERSKYNKAYIAVPKYVKDLLDGRVLKRAGIGVILYDLDTNEVVEVLPSMPIALRRQSCEDVDRRIKEVSEVVEHRIGEIAKEVSSVKAAISRIDEVSKALLSVDVSKMMNVSREIEQIWAAIERLRSEVEHLKSLCAHRESPSTEVKRAESEDVARGASSYVPSFIRDNPWIEIISKKVSRS